MGDSLENGIVNVLETAPAVEIPADFAARVAGVAGALPVISRAAAPRYGLWAVRVAVVVLMVWMFVQAPRGWTGSAVAVTVELLLVAEFVGLTVWMSLRRWA